MVVLEQLTTMTQTIVRSSTIPAKHEYSLPTLERPSFSR